MRLHSGSDSQFCSFLFLTVSEMAPRKPTPAEISLVHLKNCFVNLPASLVSLLVNIDTVSFAHLLTVQQFTFDAADGLTAC